ncbi:MAG: radical SAM protein [Elusimicrobia bacterium]|nr:radical SAM protein [Elusimicrobiota bacterium]
MGTTAISPKRGRRRLWIEQVQKENVGLNQKEFEDGRVILASTPQTVFLQIHAPCNADCVFCSKGFGQDLFRLDEWLARFGRSLTPVLQRAAKLILTGSGEVLGLREAPAILRHFNGEFPHVDKYIATNASHLTPQMCELITGSESRYTLQLSLHAPDKSTHELVMRYRAYDRVVENIERLMEMRRASGRVQVHFMFVMTSLNAERLPDFVRWAKTMGADKVLAGYFYIYEAEQKPLSLYFKQELANRVIDEARRVAGELGMPIELPHKFGQKDEARPPARCSEPWHQVMISPDGSILPCDLYGSFRESLAEKSFAEIWNGATYRAIRRELRAGGGCLQDCQRHNPVAVDEWSAHVIHRNKDEAQVLREP